MYRQAENDWDGVVKKKEQEKSRSTADNTAKCGINIIDCDKGQYSNFTSITDINSKYKGDNSDNSIGGNNDNDNDHNNSDHNGITVTENYSDNIVCNSNNDNDNDSGGINIGEMSNDFTTIKDCRSENSMTNAAII